MGLLRFLLASKREHGNMTVWVVDDSNTIRPLERAYIELSHDAGESDTFVVLRMEDRRA
jgi:hypothetical protein